MNLDSQYLTDWYLINKKMKKIDTYMLAAVFASMTASTNADEPPAIWEPNSKTFESEVTVPSTTVKVEFDAVLSWEELKVGASVLRLQNPKITINGRDSNVTVNSAGVDYRLQVEIVGSNQDDFFAINSLMVNDGSHTAAMASFVASTTTTTHVEDVDVKWTWMGTPVATVVAILDEGDSINLFHTSPFVVISNAWNANGDRINISDLPTALQERFPDHDWVLHGF